MSICTLQKLEYQRVYLSSIIKLLLYFPLQSMTESQVVKLNNDNDTVAYTKNQSSDIDITISTVDDKQNGSATTITGGGGSILEVIRNSTHSAESTVELVENNGEVNNHDLV